MAIKTLSVLIAPLLILADLSQADCTRAELSAASDGFFKAAMSKTPFATADGVKVSENGYPVANLAATTSFKSITKFDRPFQINAIDTTACQIATLAIVDETINGTSQTAPAIYSLRLKLPETGAKVSEIEIMDVSKNSNAKDAVKYSLKSASNYRVDHFPQTQPAYWTSSQTTNGTPLTRDQLINVTMGYDDEVEVGPDQDPTNPDFMIYSRRFVVDTQTGVVESAYYLDAGEDIDAFTHEYFKIQDGQVFNQTGTFVPILYGTKDAWDGGVDLPAPGLH